MTEKRFQYNVNKNSIEYDEKHFAYCNGGQSKIAKKLNVLQKENEELKQKVDFYKYFQKDARELEKENEQLKQQRDFYYARLQKIIKIANGDLE